jgi:hypothetical protein
MTQAAETVLPDGSVPPMASCCPALMTFLVATTDSVVWSFRGWRRC